MRRELERIEIPGEHEARERSWAVVRAAFAEREPQPPRRSWKPVAALALALVVVAGLLSPPGRAVLDEIREVVGVEKAQPALFSLPAPGRLLVTADSGAWVVEQDGSKRLLGELPRGVVVSVRPLRRRVAAERAGRADPGRRRALVARAAGRPLPALGRHEDRHADRLSLAEASCASSAATARATGCSTRRAAASAPSWQPGPGTCSSMRGATERSASSTWTPVQVLDARAARRSREADRAAVRTLLGDGDFAEPVRSPDGRWLAVGWPEADQLVFLHVVGRQQIRAVSNVSSPVPLALVSYDQRMVLRALIVAASWQLLRSSSGRSYEGRPIDVVHVAGAGQADPRRRLHPRGRVRGDRGDEASRAVAPDGRSLARPPAESRRLRARSRTNAHGVDLNRDFLAATSARRGSRAS